MKSEEIDLKVYFVMIKKWLWLIALVVTAFTALAAWYSYKTYVPVYHAQTKIIVNAGNSDPFSQQTINIGTGSMESGLISTYKEIIRTPFIMDKVVQLNPNLEVSSDYLTRIVDVYALNNTQVVIIAVNDYSHERAVMIANAITRVFQAELPNISEGKSVVILNEAKMSANPQPINEKQNTYIILGFMASLILSVGAVILLESLDDKLRTEEDVAEALGIPTLAYIPKMTKRKLKPKKKVGGGTAYAPVKQ